MGNGSGKLEDRYYLQKVKLGQGSFGTVWRAVDRHTNETVAIKQLDKAAMPRRGVKRHDIEREINVMQAVEHENITKLLGFFEDPNSIYLALEYCDGGDFGDKVKERGMNLQEDEAAEWMRQILSAISHLHEKSICHRDIKPDNFMVHQGVLKLSDFGLAVFLERNRLLTEKCGTPAFMSPEQHKLPRHSRGYTCACDIWAAGVTMYMLMFGGRHPFLGYSSQLDDRKLLEGKLDFNVNQGFLAFAVSDGRYSEPARQLCRQLVEPDASKRISAAVACQDRWLLLGEGRRYQQFQPQPGGISRNCSAPLSELAPSPSPCRSPGLDAPTPVTARPDRRTKTAFAVDLKAMQLHPATRMFSGDSDGEGVASWMWPWGGGAENSPPPPSNPQLQQLQQQQQQQPEQADHGAKKRLELEGRIEELEAQLKLQQEQNESHREALQHNNKVVEQLKEEKKLLARQAPPAPPASAPAQASAQQAQPRKGPPPLPGFYDARRGTKESTRKGSKVSLFQNEDLSAGSRRGSKTTTGVNSDAAFFPQGPDCGMTVLPPGTKCKYNSSSWAGVIPAIVQGYNESDGTFNLDVRAHARPENICPAGDVTAAEAWPVGTLVLYQSTSVRGFLPAVIKSFNEGNGDTPGTYNLDVREHAIVERLRPRYPLQQAPAGAASTSMEAVV